MPRDKLVLCLRDGRDVVASTLATFDHGLLRKSFRQLVAEWRLATEAVLAFAPGGPRANPDTVVVRYEDVALDPKGQIGRMLPALGLDPAVYPTDRLERLPVFGSSTTKENGEQSWSRAAPSDLPTRSAASRTWPDHRKRAFEHLAGTCCVAAISEKVHTCWVG
jgi:hypothetical protein